MGFDPPEAGIFIPQVAETRHQNPFEGRLPPIISLAEPGARRLLLEEFQLGAFVQDGLQNLGDQAFPASAQAAIQLRHGRRGTARAVERFRRNVVAGHDRRVERGEIELGHVSVHTRCRHEHQAALVADQELLGAFEPLGLLFTPGDENPRLMSMEKLKR